MAKKSGKKTVAAAAAAPKLPAPAPTWPTVRGAAEGIRMGYDDLATQGKDTLSALVAANAALSEALERMSLELVSLARAAVESAAATSAGLVDAKSLEDVVALQYDFTKGCVERLIVGGARLSELGLRAASEMYEPLGARAEKAIDALKKPLAA
ncbi:MAG TPA: phasin family protein [Stellaceae bacterium]|nr:phasin family protein [Stellaceae bacterium]